MNSGKGSTLRIRECDGGCLLDVRAKPGARKEGLLGVHDGALRIGVNAAPDKGKANQALGKFLAKFTGVAASKIELVSGQTSQQKVFFIPLPKTALLEVLHNKESGL